MTSQTRLVPVLEGDMVRLRPLGPQDADAMWDGLDDAESMRLTGTTATFTREQIDEWAATIADRPGRFDWAITHDGDAYRGEIVLNNLDDDARSATLRLAVDAGHRGRGYGREAMQLVLRFAFAPPPEGLGLHRVGLDVLSINPRAQSLYESLGFVVEGRQREVYPDPDHPGRWADAIIMGMLDEDFEAASADW
ncbi:GCN5-related protein N-acetyltransferase [Beutenbergia cavernae DSM 12333]|uniref:GCN5-related protein N-acetyltransferase n=1 Tax=Beutenbergia cavernae (strain ATCC BAA-8 / DSM 12333 / CCUG 43141 / JCM 11478 / NBRC 16432 / NCIMB 13614 / HKI 0122) TaxID=471853 RepID=C5C2G0_BEUC1|nr:GNAT family protein [Beutenbergia cavernae]ACQ79646.1 GCN5-related protein N-acetyltransferase [Beutenbergia cavernae DSM 12333]